MSTTDEVIARYMARVEAGIEEEINGVREPGEYVVGLLSEDRPKVPFANFTRTNTAFDKYLRGLGLDSLYALAAQKHSEAVNELLRRRLCNVCSVYIDAVKARQQIKSLYHVPFLYPLLSSVQLIEAGSRSVLL